LQISSNRAPKGCTPDGTRARTRALRNVVAGALVLFAFAVDGPDADGSPESAAARRWSRVAGGPASPDSSKRLSM